jgi:ribokinase
MKLNSRRPRIVVIGSINMDLVVGCERVPRPGETIKGGDLAMFPGGKGANQAVAAARLGADVHMVGRVGNDAFGRTMLVKLQESGVNTRFVRATPLAATGTATILVQKGGENSIVISAGANVLVDRADVDAALPVIRRADFVLLQLEIPVGTVGYAIGLCRQLGVMSMLDPAPAPTGLPGALYRANILTPNETEAGTILGLRGKSSAGATMKRLLSAGAKRVVLKLGVRGAMYGAAGESLVVGGFKVKVVDTTAAGDCFNGALAVAMAEGRGVGDALRFANAAGALACTVMGAQASLPMRSAVVKLLASRHLKS